MSSKSNLSRTRVIAGCGMLIAVAVILQYVEFAIPVMPSFIKLDFSDLPEIIGAYAYGPLAGIVITGLKNLIHMAVSQSGFVGELSNFILGAVFSGVAGYIYQKNKTKKGALIGGIAGAAVMALVSLPSNYFVIYPMYYSILHYPEAVVLQLYQVILPSMKSVGQCLLVFNVPFTFLKGAVDVLFAMLVYKRISPILKNK